MLILDFPLKSENGNLNLNNLNKCFFKFQIFSKLKTSNDYFLISSFLYLRSHFSVVVDVVRACVRAVQINALRGCLTEALMESVWKRNRKRRGSFL